jgi:hypothetical protein
MRHRDKERIGRLERNGTMDRRREELRAWFGMHPRGSALQAITDLGYSYRDYMHVVADSIRIDLARGTQVAANCLTAAPPSINYTIPICHEPRSSARMRVAGRRNPQISGCPRMPALAIFLRTRDGADNW